MFVQFLDAPGFSIDANGRLERSGSWLVSAANESENIAELALEWAGTTGDAWREPDHSGSSYTLDHRLSVTAISAEALDSQSYRITFKGSPCGSDSSNDDPNSNISAVSGSLKFERRSDLCEYKTASFILENTTPETMPEVGDMIDWAGENYRCESLTAEALADGRYSITLKAVNAAIEPFGTVESEYSANGETKTARFMVVPEALTSFMSSNCINAPAPWAGENYYIFQAHCEPANSACRSCVTLTARVLQTKLIETLRSEEIVSMASGVPETLSVWQSRWRASAEDREFFESKLGTSALEWTGNEQTIISKITPKRISDREFEYIMEARDPDSIVVGSGNRYWKDRDLPDKFEYYIRCGELRLSPLQCGYTWRQNGSYRLLPNWQPIMLCPLDTVTALPMYWINQAIKLLEILEVSYMHGVSSENISSIAPWFTAARISTQPLAGISGSFLRYDLSVEDMTDSRGKEWTKITKVYRLAPAGMSWNVIYWI